MSIQTLDFARPFFELTLLREEPHYLVSGSSILLNLGDSDIAISRQRLAPLQSVIVRDVEISSLQCAVLIERLYKPSDDTALFEAIKRQWPSAFDVRGEERLRGVSHYMSPKFRFSNIGLSIYHSGSVPLNVGLHKDHAFCPVPGFREVHTQLVGFGKMQQCHKRDLDTLYIEEPMAPGSTHRPMYDEHGNYPWHQFETITPSVFMAVEILPPGADWPQGE